MLVLAAVVNQVNGATRSLSERVNAGECSFIAPVTGETYFPTASQSHSDAIGAHFFDIYYAQTFKVVVSHVAKEQYVLTQCGQTAPINSAIDAVHSSLVDNTYTRKHFTVPLQSAIAAGTVHAGFLDNIEVEDRIHKVDSYSSASCWQKLMGCGGTLTGAFTNATLRAMEMDAVDAVFMDCGFSGCSNVHSQANGIHAAASQDPSPLKSAEYLKFFGAFFNKEPQANTVYQTVQTSYNLATVNTSAKKIVAWVAHSTWGGEKFVVSTAQYKMDMVDDAGGINFNADLLVASMPAGGVVVSGSSHEIPLSAFNGSRANASSYLLAAFANVDVVIDETYASDPTTYTYATFQSYFPLESGSTAPNFMQQQRVLRVDRDLGASSPYGLDWYESRIPRPDWAIEGLARYLVDDNSKRHKYFRNIATNEALNPLSSTSCSKTLPACQSTMFAEAIPTLGTVTGNTNSNRALTTYPHAFIGIVFALVFTWRSM